MQKKKNLRNDSIKIINMNVSDCGSLTSRH